VSVGSRIRWAEAYEIAGEVARRIDPLVARSKCVGSVRRRKDTVGDIEFVVEPFMHGDLLGNEEPVLEVVRATMLELGDWVKGGPRMMQVTNLLKHKGLTLDLYLAHAPAAWGSTVAIRTGPADMGRYVVTACRDFGYRHENGYAQHLDTGERVPTDTEEQFFALASLPCLPPQQREQQAQMAWAAYRMHGAGR